MSQRLPTGGRLVDRTQGVQFTFDGRHMRGLQGDTLATALLANGQTLVGRSFKYHRPRGIVASGPEEPNALLQLGLGARTEPNAVATVTDLHEGMAAQSQNRWPSLRFDLGAVSSLAGRFLPAGFYYKTFIHPRPFWKHVFEPVIRHAAGLGRAPKDRDPDRYEQAYAHCDVLVVGGGSAGLAAAGAAAGQGQRVILVEQSAHWGGRAPVDDGTRPDLPDPRVTRHLRTTAIGVHDHGYVLAVERLPYGAELRERLWRIRAGHVVIATGAIERPLAFAGNDLPGVMLASAVRDFVVNHAVTPGDRTVIVTNNDTAYLTAIALHEAGLAVPAILDDRPQPAGGPVDRARALGLRILPGHAIARVRGRSRVTGVEVCLQAGEGTAVETIPCDCVAMSGGWSPAVHLFSHAGGKLIWDEAQAAFRPDPQKPPVNHDGSPLVSAVGAANGELSWQGPIAPVWIMPAGAPIALRQKMWLDFQNDVKVSDIQLAAREGYASVEHAKRYTTLGMATDQGKLSNINGLAVLADALGAAIPQVGTTTFRPPYTPVTVGTLAGEARGEIFQPLRRTPVHAWHEAQGAHFEPVGLWRRPYCYPRRAETHTQAVAREVTNTRTNVGLLDASTLGKIIVKGPDAGRFLDMLYTGVFSTLPVGKCRYGLMCNEQGFLTDDGVVARLAEDTWLCHTTSGGADRIHAWMEDWLQCEWWDWQVYTANVTEQYAQVAVVGPRAREVLSALGGMDLGAAALPFMHWAEGTLAGIQARVFRISFSGELSYEVAVPAGQGMAFWQACLAAGAAHGVMPYGTEALHVMRAEKGFIMIGDETDGTVTPQDLGLTWAIGKKKDDYLGKRGQARSHLAAPDRWRLVGLQTLDGSVLPDGAYAAAPGINANGQRNTEGRVTSTYWSPTLKSGIALGLVQRGPERMGETLSFVTTTGATTLARIVDPVFYDKAGARQDG